MNLPNEPPLKLHPAHSSRSPYDAAMKFEIRCMFTCRSLLAASVFIGYAAIFTACEAV